MKFTETPLRGAWQLEPERYADERGFFARTFCREEFRAHGIEGVVEQCSTSFNARRLTLRGMHWQDDPHAEDKLVRCTSGAIFDVIVDLRADSSTRAQWWGLELTAERGNQLYIPKGFAHGFLTLEDHTEVGYQMSVPFSPDAAAGFRYDDPGVGIEWPERPEVVSAKDLELPRLAELEVQPEGLPGDV